MKVQSSFLKNRCKIWSTHGLQILRGAERGKTTDDGFSISRLCYLFPKRLVGAAEGEVGIVGGTGIQRAGAGTRHEEEFPRVLAIARGFFGTTNNQ